MPSLRLSSPGLFPFISFSLDNAYLATVWLFMCPMVLDWLLVLQATGQTWRSSNKLRVKLDFAFVFIPPAPVLQTTLWLLYVLDKYSTTEQLFYHCCLLLICHRLQCFPSCYIVDCRCGLWCGGSDFPHLGVKLCRFSRFSFPWQIILYISGQFGWENSMSLTNSRWLLVSLWPAGHKSFLDFPQPLERWFLEKNHLLHGSRSRGRGSFLESLSDTRWFSLWEKNLGFLNAHRSYIVPKRGTLRVFFSVFSALCFHSSLVFHGSSQRRTMSFICTGASQLSHTVWRPFLTFWNLGKWWPISCYLCGSHSFPL